MGSLRPNEWMENEQFISKMKYHNLYYVKNLGQVLGAYLRAIPIPVITTWDPNFKRIYFHVGLDKHYFDLDENVSYWDYTFLAGQWLSSFFPSYCVEEEEDVELSEAEIWNKVRKEGLTLDDALLLRKPALVKTTGKIIKIQITNDEFIFNNNGKEEVRISGTLEKLIPLSLFLKELRRLTDDHEKKNYILSNSRLIKELNETKREIVIDYPDQMMRNFFIIRYDSLRNDSFSKTYEGLYKWGRFIIKFNSLELERDCIHFLNQRRSEEGLGLVDVSY